MASSFDKRPPSSPGMPAEGSLLRLRLRYPDVQTFVERFATNVTRGGVFLASKTPKPVGTLIRFELLLADGKSRVMRGEGTVSWVREFDEANPNRPCGMGIKFSRLDGDSARLVERIEAHKRERGLTGEVPVVPPTAEPDERTMVARPPEPPSVEMTPMPAAISMPVAVSAPVAAPAPVPTPVVDDGELERLIEADGAALDERLIRARAMARALVGDDLEAEFATLVAEAPPLPPILARPGSDTLQTEPPPEPTSPEIELAAPPEPAAAPLPPPPTKLEQPQEPTAVTRRPDLDEALGALGDGDATPPSGTTIPDAGGDDDDEDHTTVSATPMAAMMLEPEPDEASLDLPPAPPVPERKPGFFKKLFKPGKG